MKPLRFIYIFLLALLTSFNLTAITAFLIFPDTLVPATPEETFEKFQKDRAETKRLSHFRCSRSKDMPQLIRLPYLENSWHIVHSCDDINSHEVASSILYFYVQWVSQFGDEDLSVFTALNNIVVEWGPEKKIIRSAYSMDGEYLENVTIVGLAISPEMIWCHFPPGSKISSSSLVHELVHISLWAKYNTPDADHEGTVHMGWTKDHTEFISSVRLELKMSGQ